MDSYILNVKLKRAIPHILPIHGLRVKCAYNGVKRQCKIFYEYLNERSTGKNTNKKMYKCKKDK